MELFKIVDEDGSGMLSVDEFKLFLKSDKANLSKSYTFHKHNSVPATDKRVKS